VRSGIESVLWLLAIKIKRRGLLNCIVNAEKSSESLSFNRKDKAMGLKLTKEVEIPKELTGNILVTTIGCKQCPRNEEYRVFNKAETDEITRDIGKTTECANCHGKWILKRVQLRAVILDTESDETDSEEWRVSPLFIPVMASFNIKTLEIVDVPVSLLDDDTTEET